MQRSVQSEENRVIVRYWPGLLSSFNVSSTGSWVSFGHVSLQTFVGGPDNKGYYISFWRADIDKRCCGKQEDHIHGREEDLQYGGQANIENTFTLYTLNTKAINAAYEEMIRRGLKWDLRGSLLHSKDENAAVCSSLIYRLLVAGGIEKLVSANERLFLGFKSTAQKSLFAGALGFGTLSSILKNLVLNCGHVELIVDVYKNNEKRQVVYNFFHWGTSSVRELPFVKSFSDHSYVIHLWSPLRSLRTLVYRTDYVKGPYWCNLIIATTLSMILVGLLTSQRAVTNYFVIKPDDFPLLMKRAILAEQRLPRSGVTFFDRRTVSTQDVRRHEHARPALI